MALRFADYLGVWMAAGKGFYLQYMKQVHFCFLLIDRRHKISCYYCTEVTVKSLCVDSLL